MRWKRVYLVLGIIFLISLSVRLYLAFHTKNFNLDGYFIKRQVEHILNTGLPLFEDSLSFSGKNQVFMPLYHYILAFFNLFLPFSLVGKIIPNIFASLITFTSFGLVYLVTMNRYAGLLTAFISAFIPVFLINTVNTISPIALVAPLLLLQIYLFLKKRVKLFIGISFILSLIHFSAIIFPLSMVLLLILSRVEHFKISRKHVEMIVFSIVLNLWLILIFFKKAILFHGVEIFFKNMPIKAILEVTQNTNILNVVYLVGVIPFIYGVISAYHLLFKKRDFDGFVLLSFVITTVLVTWFTLMDITPILIFLGAFLSILFGYYYHATVRFLNKTKFSKLRYYKSYFLVSVTIAFLVTSIIPSVMSSYAFVNESLTHKEEETLEWVRYNTPEDSTILTSLDEGDLITSVSERKNVIDPHFLLIDKINIKYEDYEEMFTSSYQTQTLKLMEKYGVDYVYVSFRTENNLDFSENKFGGECFEEVFSNSLTSVYEVKCELKE